MKKNKRKINRIITRCVAIVFAFTLMFMGCGQWEGGERILSEHERQLNMESFGKVWSTIRDHHYDPELGGLDWQGVYDELVVKMKSARKMSEARSILTDMISRLNQSHFNIIPKGDFGYSFSSNGFIDRSSAGFGDAVTGMGIRVPGNQVLVTTVKRDSPAFAAGVKPGWLILEIAGTKTSHILEQLKRELDVNQFTQLTLTIYMQSLLTGKVGGSMSMQFLDGNNTAVDKKIKLIKPKGKMFSLGNLLEEYVRIETKKLKNNTGYIAFNAFMDIPRIMPAFNRAMKEYMSTTTDGIIIDLRGNTGGIVGMAAGMAGWLISEKGKSLGTQVTRETELKIIVHPRLHTYTGPVAILVDFMSASTSEIFAAGLKDLGRARIFGETTAGAALPSTHKRLPNGDVFQYVVANYKRINGDTLEGKGLVPDEVTPTTREALLKGSDAPLDAAVKWIHSQKTTQGKQLNNTPNTNTTD